MCVCDVYTKKYIYECSESTRLDSERDQSVRVLRNIDASTFGLSSFSTEASKGGMKVGRIKDPLCTDSYGGLPHLLGAL